MNILLQRKFLKPKYTIGDFFVDGALFANSLELPYDYNNNGIHNEPNKECIPAGQYLINMTWSNTFQKYLPEAMYVQGRTGIRIHAAAKPEQLLGCIAVGKNNVVGGLTGGIDLYMPKLKNLIYGAMARDEIITLKITQ